MNDLVHLGGVGTTMVSQVGLVVTVHSSVTTMKVEVVCVMVICLCVRRDLMNLVAAVETRATTRRVDLVGGCHDTYTQGLTTKT